MSAFKVINKQRLDNLPTQSQLVMFSSCISTDLVLTAGIAELCVRGGGVHDVEGNREKRAELLKHEALVMVDSFLDEI